MNSIIRRSNISTPNFRINDSSPSSFQKKLKLETITAEIQEEKLSEFTKYYRKIVRQETLINSPSHQEEISQQLLLQQPPQSTHLQNALNNNPFTSRHTLELSDMNDENFSRASFEVMSPLKRASKSLGIIKPGISPIPQFSTCISLQNNSEMKSPSYSTSSKKVEFSPTQKNSQRINQIDSFRIAAEQMPLIKMQNTFYAKQSKSQNQQFLEKCLEEVSTPRRENGFSTPRKFQKYQPFNISTTSKNSDKKNELNSFYRAVRVQDMDFLTRLNNESQLTINKTELSHINNFNSNNKSSRATSLTEIIKTKQGTDKIAESYGEGNITERINRFPKKLSPSLPNSNPHSRSVSQIQIHKDVDYSMSNPQNFNKHLKSLQDLSQTERKRRKVIGFVDQMIKQKLTTDNETDSQKKPFKLILQQKQTPSHSLIKSTESKGPSRRSSIEISEQLHYFKRKAKLPTKLTSQEDTNKIQTQQLVGSQKVVFSGSNSSQVQINSPQNSLSIIVEKNKQDVEFEERIQQCIKIAQDACTQLLKLFALNISRQKIIKLLKSFLSGNSPVLNLLLDDNKVGLQEDINPQMFEELIISRDPSEQEAHLLIEHELIFLTSKVQEYMLQTDLHQCEIYKKDILNECQNLQDMAQNLNKRNKEYQKQAFKVLENLSFMGNNMFNKQHSVIDQLANAELKFGKLSTISPQNLNMNTQMENKIEKMVKLRQGQIKMLDIFSAKKMKK